MEPFRWCLWIFCPIGGRFSSEVTPSEAVLRISGAQQSDEGPYLIVIENNLGDDSGFVNVNVKGELPSISFPPCVQLCLWAQSLLHKLS